MEPNEKEMQQTETEELFKVKANIQKTLFGRLLDYSEVDCFWGCEYSF